MEPGVDGTGRKRQAHTFEDGKESQQYSQSRVQQTRAKAEFYSYYLICCFL